MIGRRGFLFGLAAGITGTLTAEAQPARKTPRVGVLFPGDPSQGNAGDAFQAGLREAGRVDGQDITIEYRWAEARLDRQAERVVELIRLPVDVLVVGTTGAAIAARHETTTLPIVSAGAGALVEAGVAASLARPGGNVTGLTALVPELVAKRLELLKQAVPKLTRVGALVAPYSRPSLGDIFVTQTVTAARAAGVELQLLSVESPGDLDAVFQAATQRRAGAVVITPNPFFMAHAGRVAELALKHRLPMIAGDPGFVDAGCLMAYEVDYRDMWRRAAGYVDRILKGAKPSDLPIEQPTKFTLVVNLKTARAIGLTIPESILLRADHVIQ